jgi:Fe-S cluster biogenesis protein NfuA
LIDAVARVERVLDDLDESGLAAVEAVVDLYGEALRRLVAGADPVEDELVSHLLIAHGLHPVAVEQRIETALDAVRPYLGSHGGGVELLGVEDGVARVRLDGTCHGCPSSRVTLEHAIEDAVLRAAPEVERIEAVGEDEPVAPALLQLKPLACPAELVPS